MDRPRKRRLRFLVTCLSLTSFYWHPSQIQAQGKFASEEHFHDLFVTAGYSTAFGAALGAAVLGLTENPTKNLHYIGIGASLGFITGSLFGTYVVFLPALTAQNDSEASTTLSLGVKKVQKENITIEKSQTPRLTISPQWNVDKNRVETWQLGWAMASF